MIRYTLAFLILLLVSSSGSFAQADSNVKKVNNAVRESLYKQQSWHDKIRNGIYNEKGFTKYKGKIEVLKGSVIQYDSIIVNLYTARPEYKIIFEKGIFYPGVFSGDQSGEITHPGKRPDSATAFGNCFTHYNVIGIDVYDEIKPEKPNHKSKQFRMWRWLCGRVNPWEYIFALDNESANEKTSLEDFIKGSKLTFIRFVTIII